MDNEQKEKTHEVIQIESDNDKPVVRRNIKDCVFTDLFSN